MASRTRSAVWAALAAGAALWLSACGGDGGAPTGVSDGAAQTPDARLRVVTTVSPLRNIVENVGGDRVVVVGLVPEGTNSHTFEPPPSAVSELAAADLIVVNGLNLELPTLELAEANAREGVPIVSLGERTVTPGEYVYDFSFPADDGNPNPHLWTAPHLAMRYAEIVAAELSALDAPAAPYYADNLERYAARLRAMDEVFARVLATIPPANRKLLTYHDSFPYFGPRYGLTIIGAIQPSDFSEPSPREVAALIVQIRDAGVPAIFGSEVFPSEVLDTIASEAGAVQVSTLRDDDLPADAGDVNNTLVAMMVENVRTMAAALGGDAAELDGFDVTDTWEPYAEFEG